MDASQSTPGLPSCAACQERDRRIAQLEKLVAELKARLATAERAGKRQAAPFSQRPPKEHPKKPGRKSGQQHGPHGHRPPPPPEAIDEVHEATLPELCDCGGGIHETHVDTAFQTEIPRRVLQRQFNIHCGHCRRCGRRHRGRHPLQTSDASGAAASQLGPDAQAAVVYLNKQAGLSHGKIAAVFQHFYRLKITPGGCAHIVRRGAERLRPAHEEIRAKLKEAEHITPDETGWRVGGQPAWMHVGVGNNGATLYVVDRRRSAEVLEEVIGVDWPGSMTHDGYSSYDRFEDAVHQQCVDHAMRRAEALLEKQGPSAAAFSQQVIDLFSNALEVRDQFEAGVLDGALGPEVYDNYVDKLQELTQGRRRNADNEKFAKHLHKHASEWFVFLLDPTIPATNHRAEQALKTPITNRKVWGGNRTPTGSDSQEVISSVLQTCKNLACDVFAIISQAFCGRPTKLFPAATPNG